MREQANFQAPHAQQVQINISLVRMLMPHPFQPFRFPSGLAALNDPPNPGNSPPQPHIFPTRHPRPLTAGVNLATPDPFPFCPTPTPPRTLAPPGLFLFQAPLETHPSPPPPRKYQSPMLIRSQEAFKLPDNVFLEKSHMHEKAFSQTVTSKDAKPIFYENSIEGMTRTISAFMGEKRDSVVSNLPREETLLYYRTDRISNCPTAILSSEAIKNGSWEEFQKKLSSRIDVPFFEQERNGMKKEEEKASENAMKDAASKKKPRGFRHLKMLSRKVRRKLRKIVCSVKAVWAGVSRRKRLVIFKKISFVRSQIGGKQGRFIQVVKALTGKFACASSNRSDELNSDA